MTNGNLRLSSLFSVAYAAEFIEEIYREDAYGNLSRTPLFTFAVSEVLGIDQF